MKRILTLAFAILLGFGAQAQDPHFSQFYASPVLLNPALTGAFNGNYRLSAIYREQWGSILRNSQSGLDQLGTPLYRTYGAAADFRTNKGFSDYDAFGFGVSLMGDKAGASNFGTINANISTSYQRALNYDRNHFLSIGFQGGVSYRTIDTEHLTFGTQWDGFQYNSMLPQDNFILSNTFNSSFPFYDVSAGLLWYMVGGERMDAYLGGAVFHINEPNESFSTDNLRAELPMRLSFHGGIHFPLAGQIDLLPKFIVFFQGQSFETDFGTEMKFFFDPNKPDGNAFYLGAMYRIVGGDKSSPWGDQSLNSEAIIITASLEYVGLTIGAAYDINVSELTSASLSRGSFEVSAVFTGAFGDRRPRTVHCPRF